LLGKRTGRRSQKWESAAGVDDDVGMVEEVSHLPEALGEWTDVDVAMFELGRALGVFAPSESFNRVKGVFWGDNALGQALYDTLRALVSGGIVEENRDDSQMYRWNAVQPSRRAV